MTKTIIIIGAVCFAIALFISLKATNPRKRRRYAYAAAFAVLLLIGLHLPPGEDFVFYLENNNSNEMYADSGQSEQQEYAPAYWEYADYVDWSQYSQVTPEVVDATSYLQAESMDYVPGLAVDGNLDTCWQEGVDGYGEGHDFFAKFAVDFTPQYIVIYNGQSRDENRFYKNGRIASLQISAGEHIEIIDLPDEMTPIAIKLTGWGDVSGISFKILSVYEGSKYQDTCLTELMFYQ